MLTDTEFRALAEHRKIRSLRLSDAEWQVCRDAGKLAGMTPTMWVRMQIRLNGADQLTRAGRPVAFFEESAA